MKTLFLCFIILFSANILAQRADLETADIEIPITIFDNSGLPNNSRTIFCGIDPMATDSIDSSLGEFWLFCPFAINGTTSDCIPYDHFEVVFDIPIEPPPGSFEFGSWKDFRFGTVPYSGTETYRICYLPYEAATSVYISWDFPEGVTGVLQVINIYYTMTDSGTYTHPYLRLINSVWMTLTYQNVTPVELVSFNAVLIDDNIQLEWLTTTETNNSGFEILRFTQNDNEWNSIGFVSGFGTTTEPKSYSFIDESVTSGIYKYRLKQIDFDGTFTFSNEIEVEVDFTPKEFVLYQNYPNPFNPTTVISYQLPVNGNVTLKVYDVLGNEIATLVNEEKPAGAYEVEFDGSMLSSGIYFYQLKAGSYSSINKMVLLK